MTADIGLKIGKLAAGDFEEFEIRAAGSLVHLASDEREEPLFSCG
jgi:hypothetical protein